MALLLFCITSIRAPTMPAVGAGVGGPDSGRSDTWRHKNRPNQIRNIMCVNSWSLLVFIQLQAKDFYLEATKTSVRCRDRLTVLSWIPCRIWSSRASRPVVEGGALLFCSTFFSWVPPLICSSSADFPPGLGE